MTITLKDYEILACHGVNPEEKVQKQRFLVTAQIEEEFCGKDDLSQTVSYSAVKKLIKAYVEGNCFNLIETIADGIARKILKEFPLALSVKVEVKKPDAPMSGKFDYVSAETALCWHTAYIALGSSLGDKDALLNFAVQSLKDDESIKEVRESKRLHSAPYGGVAKEEFVNSVLECKTLLTPHRLLALMQRIENDGGRVRHAHWEDRTLDLDLLFYDGEVISTPDLCVPHPDMQNRDFVLAPIMELNENLFHPLLQKRVRDLYFALTTCEK